MTTTATRKHVTVVLGYVIRTRESGVPWYGPMQTRTVYAIKGQPLPSEWEETKNNPAIEEAQIYKTTQITKRADRRTILDSFKR
jgi:hypothetical protein